MMKQLFVIGSGCLLLAGCAVDQTENTSVEEQVTTQSVPYSIWEDEHVVGVVHRYEEFPSSHIDARTIAVWLPTSYDEASEKKYPVVYMHDGQNVFDPDLSYHSNDEWGVDEAMVRLSESGQISEAIVVGVWSTEKRFEEYMPRKAVDSEQFDIPTTTENMLSPSDLISDDYLLFLTSELKPFIDDTYRTNPEPAATSIMGSSMGGLISIYAMSEYPDIYGQAACVSTHWPAADGAVVRYLADHLPSAENHRVYFDFGTEGLDALYEPFQIQMDALMKQADYVENDNWITLKFENADHTETDWRARVDEPLTFLLGKQQ